MVDATGVGRPIVDLLRDAGHAPVAVSITAGKAITFDGDTWHVPKRELVRALVVAMESGRLKTARRILLADALVRELAAFKVRVSQQGHDTYEGRGEHDDLVIATALAVGGAADRPAAREPADRVTDARDSGGCWDPATSEKGTQRRSQRERLLRVLQKRDQLPPKKITSRGGSEPP